MNDRMIRYIHRIAKQEHPRDQIHCQVMLDYYPFTNKCPIGYHQEGIGSRGACKMTGCRIYHEGKCLHFEVECLMYQIFHTTQHNYWIPIGKTASWILDTGISFERIYVQLRCYDNNAAIDYALRDLNLWDLFEPRETPWGHPTKLFPLSFDSLPLVTTFLSKLFELGPQISARVRHYLTCLRCTKITSSPSIYYKRYPVCDQCQEEIVRKWVDRATSP